METQGEMLVNVTSRMQKAEEEVKHLKRTASREDPIPDVKRFCVDEAVKQICRLNEERKLSAKREASKQTLTSKERKRRGLAPAGEPKGAMLNCQLYFNWRSQGPNHRPPVNDDWMVELLLKLYNEMLRHMGGAILSEVYGSALIMMRSQRLIDKFHRPPCSWQ